MTTPLLTYRTAPAHGVVHVDLDRLIASRMLVQANSGGGKSRAIRQLLEETHGRVQHLVIDPEGEFPTLRERFDYVLAAKTGGDAIAHPKYAKRLCHHLVELGVSAVLDLYDLTLDERREFVRHFLTELMALPRSLWHPIIVVIDEMHVFAPEAGQSQAAEAVTALATQGRKRGFCLVGATQRISKLHKDVAAELLNKMIGRTGLDIDVKRAGDELGMHKDERAGLKTLAPGEFFVYGPAIANEVQIVKTGAVTTSHPEAGKVGSAPPPPSAKIRAMLAQLADLPKEAEEEARTLDDFKRQVATLRTQLTKAQKSGTIVEKPVTVIDQRAIERAVAAAARAQAGTIKQLRDALDVAMKFIINISTKNFDVAGVDKAELERAVQSAMAKATELVDRKLSARTKEMDELRLAAQRVAEKLKRVLSADAEDVVIDVAVTRNEPFSVSPSPTRRNGDGVTQRATSRAIPSSNGNGNGADLPKGKQKIINALAELEAIGVESPGRAQLGMFAGYNLTGGTGGQHIADLNSVGLIDLPDKGVVRLTDEGRAAAEAIDPPSSLDELHERMLGKLPEGQRKILKHLIEVHPDAISRAELGEAVGYNLTGGTGGQHVADLVTLGAATLPQSGKVRASDILFPDGLR